MTGDTPPRGSLATPPHTQKRLAGDTDRITISSSPTKRPRTDQAETTISSRSRSGSRSHSPDELERLGVRPIIVHAKQPRGAVEGTPDELPFHYTLGGDLPTRSDDVAKSRTVTVVAETSKSAEPRTATNCTAPEVRLSHDSS